MKSTAQMEGGASVHRRHWGWGLVSILSHRLLAHLRIISHDAAPPPLLLIPLCCSPHVYVCLFSCTLVCVKGHHVSLLVLFIAAFRTMTGDPHKPFLFISAFNRNNLGLSRMPFALLLYFNRPHLLQSSPERPGLELLEIIFVRFQTEKFMCNDWSIRKKCAWSLIFFCWRFHISLLYDVRLVWTDFCFVFKFSHHWNKSSTLHHLTVRGQTFTTTYVQNSKTFFFFLNEVENVCLPYVVD